MRLLWGFLGGKQILLLLGLDVQEDSAGNIVILALWEESLPENRAKIQDVTPRERKKKKNRSLDNFRLLNPTMPEDLSIM